MKSPSPESISTLERELQLSLRPVQPNPDFVNRLHSRLSNPGTTRLERQTDSLATPVFFLVSFGLAVGLLLVWALRQIR